MMNHRSKYFTVKEEELPIYANGSTERDRERRMDEE
jgi:hypothetical protein